MLRNIRHERFAQGIAQGKSVTDAYVAAGFKARGRSAEVAGSRLLRNVEVSRRLDELTAKLESAAIADAEEIQRFFTQVLRGEVTEELMTKDGFLVTAVAQVKERLRAGELLGKARGMFTLSSSDSEGELLAIAQALAQTGGARPPPN